MKHPEPRTDTGLSPIAAGLVVAGVLGIGAWLGKRNAPANPKIARWYHRLDKPSFTPPDSVFAAVWPAIESGMAMGGYRLLRAPASPRRNAALGLWLLESAMIGGWTHIFFREHRLGSSAVGAGAMALGGTAYALTARKIDRAATAAGVPLIAWTGFATVLAEQIRRRNRPPEAAHRA